DFARAKTSGAEPNLHVESNAGFDSFSVPVPANAHIVSPSANVGEVNPNLKWRSRNAGGQLSWSTDMTIPSFDSPDFPSPTSLATLDWGVLYSFSFTSTLAPGTGSAMLHVAESGDPVSYQVATLVPGGATGRATK
ncbi:MAG: hypothetical protein ABIQ70_10180, partial [Dokdonella sp.]